MNIENMPIEEFMKLEDYHQNRCDESYFDHAIEIPKDCDRKATKGIANKTRELSDKKWPEEFSYNHKEIEDSK